MSTEMCIWSQLFDEDARLNLEDGFIITGLLSVILGSWLNLCLLFSKLRANRSYRNLANFTIVASVRRIAAVTPHLPFIVYFKYSYAFQFVCCNFFGFLETFLAVFEVEALTHVCIERYVVAKYTTNGWPINKNHYGLFLYLCLFFACLYSCPPLIGIGRYGYDFSCTSCTFDVLLPHTWHRYVVVSIFLLRSIKSFLTMSMMLIWAHLLERKYTSSGKSRQDSYFTRNVMIVTLVNLLCWTPIALIRGEVILSQLFYIDSLKITSFVYIKWAMWIHWAAPAFTAITLFLIDDKVRYNMINFSSAEDNTDEEETKED